MQIKKLPLHSKITFALSKHRIYSMSFRLGKIEKVCSPKSPFHTM